MSKTRELVPHEFPAFVSLEASRAIAIEAAHRMIVHLAGIPRLNGAGAIMLRTLTDLLNDCEALELRRFVVRQRAGVDARPDLPPDMARAEKIAAGEDPNKP